MIPETNTNCTKVCNRRETFRAHLSKEHSKTALDIEVKLDRCRVGRNHEKGFWCGFCEEFIPAQQDSINAWAARYDHIDDHFSGKHNMEKKSISEWKHPDAEHSDGEAGSIGKLDAQVGSDDESKTSTKSDGASINGDEGASPDRKRKSDVGCGDGGVKKARKNSAQPWECVSLPTSLP
jgi:hypothetical protein